MTSRVWTLIARLSLCVRRDGRAPGRPSHRLADLGPAILRVVPGDRLQKNHAGPIGMELVGGPRGEQREMPTAGPDESHLPPRRLGAEANGPFLARRNHRGIGELEQPDLDLAVHDEGEPVVRGRADRKSTRLNSSHTVISYAVFCLKKKKKKKNKKQRIKYIHRSNS